MELRVLKYFLMAAREENITRAAELLHVTQPTLSRQLIQLEEELGTKLFHRGGTHIVLTDDGMLLRRRAREIVDLAEKTRQELSHGEELAGEISIGCGETRNMTFLSGQIARFRAQHPLVRFNIYSANADDIRERMERGLLDLGLLMEPVDISRYAFVRMPEKEQWGVLVREDSPLAGRRSVTAAELAGVPLIMAGRESVRNELANWFGDVYERLEIAATYNLLLNAVNMVRCGVGAALTFHLGSDYAQTSFVPLSPRLEAGAVLAWKKEQMVSSAPRLFIERMRECVLGISGNSI